MTTSEKPRERSFPSIEFTDSEAGAREFFAAQQKAMKKLVTDLGVQPQ